MRENSDADVVVGGGGGDGGDGGDIGDAGDGGDIRIDNGSIADCRIDDDVDVGVGVGADADAGMDVGVDMGEGEGVVMGDCGDDGIITRLELLKIKHPQLKQICRYRGVKIGGNKMVVVDRLFKVHMY